MSVFEVTGSFLVPWKKGHNGKGRFVDERSLRDFWETCDFANQRGCYVFSLKAAKGELPYYVGKAAKQPFSKECFALHKLKYYNDLLNQRKGTPYVYFVVNKRTKKWSTVLIDKVEEFLIARAAVRNSNLLNKQRLPNQKWKIIGVVGPGEKGRRTTEAAAFRKVLGIK